MTGRRVHERYDCNLDVTVAIDGLDVVATATNVSLGGIFVSTEMEVAYGTQGKLTFRVPALKEDAVVDVTVRWVKPGGLGLQFGSLRAIEVWALNQYFKTLTPSPLPES